MNRKEFVRLCGILGMSLPFQSILNSCKGDDSIFNFSGSVLIIGAGAAGMASGYLLAQRGIDFQILEASPAYGGRMKRTTAFADFPIPLGAEWLHVKEKEFSDIVNDPSVQITTQTQGYNPQDPAGFFDNGVLTIGTLGNFRDRKFINATWFDFFEEYIVPTVRSKMSFNTQITAINYQGDKVVLTDNNGEVYEADKAIVTVPLKILQDGDVNFTPPLPAEKVEALEEAVVWGGIKVFMEFTEKFYPAYLTFADSETSAGQRVYYDAAYAQNTTANVLGLFAVGEQAQQYQALSGDAQRDFILRELDEIFDGRASQTFIKHMVQDWNKEPFIRAAYLADVAPDRVSRTLSHSLDQKVFFAGDAYTRENDWSAVHNAARSARDAIQELIS